MRELMKKYPKGDTISLGENEAIISTELRKIRDYYYIVADIIKNIDFTLPCGVLKIHENIALVIRNRELLQQMGFSAEERKAIYCHELGHVFSKNQLSNASETSRQIDDEIDSDTFAIEKCGVSPKILESALKKTYEYEINQIPKKKDVTQERIDRFTREMQLRKRNIEKLIRDKNSIDL